MQLRDLLAGERDRSPARPTARCRWAILRIHKDWLPAYDIGVTAAQLIAKRRLREQFVVHSDGSDAQWLDARRICQRILGYGDWFGIVEEQVEEDWPYSESPTEKRKVTLRTLVEIEPSKLA